MSQRRKFAFAPGVIERCRAASRASRRAVLAAIVTLVLALLGAGAQFWLGGLLP